ncbi:NACHT domain-containing protein [Calothrix sp. PCC 6303]|uniref:NACHT domain-containing protein n=1 Tax=Calothrix sp. PCC 6303 TaxID=1170562 RepID=UPI0002A01DC7|nr:NACHT domain-containing protein [Calothrix sp. PCC 6303]AFZ03329.1 pentapeptide repeat-containing protein [Calothrix sp. PCC 6303]
MNLSIRHWLAEKKQQSYHKQSFCTDVTARLSFSIIADLEVKSLTTFDLCPLAEILELPLSVVWQEVEFVATVTENLLNNLSQKKPLKRNEGVWLTFQIAYLRGLKQVIEQEINLCKPWLARSSQNNLSSATSMLEPNDLVCEYFLPDVQLKGLLKTIRPGKLNDNQAEQALSLLDESLLVQQFKQVTVAWLMANGAEENVAKLIVQRLGYGLAGHLLAAVAENAAPLAQLQKFVRLGNPLPGNLAYQSTQATDTIDLVREQYRAHLLQQASEPLFLEVFSLKDIYVPPKGLPIGENVFESVDLIQWVEQQLHNTQSLTVIEGVAGIGKTSFCQVLANQVATKLYPTWMPILIRLRDIIYSEDLAESLNRAFFANSQVHLAEWLENPSLRCLLILDGWDELPPSEKVDKVKFLQQLLDLQSHSHHHVVLTSQPGKLVDILGELSPQFQRICIQLWEPNQLRQWFQLWGKVLSMPLSQNLFTFFKQAGLFKANSLSPELSVMVRQPLMLYLLGVLYRDGLLDEEILKLAYSTKKIGAATLMWEIYQRLSFWLLGYPHRCGVKPILIRETETHIHRTQDAIAFQLQGLKPQDLLQKIKAVSLQILQSQQGITVVDVETSRLLPSF